MIARNG